MGEAIESVVSQEFRDREILLWDDGSTDGSMDIVRKYPEVVAYRSEANQGVVATRNSILEKARGEYVLYVDSDNRLKPGAVSRFVEVMEKAPPEVAFIYGQREYFGDGDGVSRFPEFDVEILKRKNYIEMTSLFRREAIQRIGFVEGHEPEDYDLVLGLVENGFRGVLMDEVVLEYRLHEETISASFDPLQKLKLKEVLARKHPRLYSGSDLVALRRGSRRKLVQIFVQNPKPYGSRSAMVADYWEMAKFIGMSREMLRFLPRAVGRFLAGVGIH